MTGLLALSLATVAAAQSSFGMTARSYGAEERAGTSPSGHSVEALIKFEGGSPNVEFTNGDGLGERPVSPNRNLFTGTYAYRKTYLWQFYVTAGSGMTGSTAIKYGGASSSAEPSAGQGVGVGAVARFRFPLNTVIGPAFKGLLTGRYLYETWTYYRYPAPDDDKGYWAYGSGVSYEELAYGLFRLRGIPLQAASVDSRKTYAPPNKDGAYPAIDPNASPRHVGFAGWAYRGGLFVGNADEVNGDQSGIGRIQAQATLPGSMPPSACTLSLLHIGTPAAFNPASTQWVGGIGLNAYIATSTSGPAVPMGSLNWANSLVPAVCETRGRTDISTAPQNEYVNLHLGVCAPDRILLTGDETTTEDGTLDGGAPRWRYFGGSTYAPPTPVYPYSECKPHLWAFQVPNVTYTAGSTNALPPSGAWGGYPAPLNPYPGMGGSGGTLTSQSAPKGSKDKTPVPAKKTVPPAKRGRGGRA